MSLEITSISPSMRLQNLQNEPVRLKLEAERYNEELEKLVLENYRVFVENLTCSVYLRDEDKALNTYSTELSDNLKQLSFQCSTFKDRVNYIINAHKKNRKTLKHNLQIVELLEIPQLVEACTRNGFHDEALELAAFANSLERKHILALEIKNQEELSKSTTSSNITTTTGDSNSLQKRLNGGKNIVQNIVDDVHKTLSELRGQLLQKLSEEAALPKLLTILSALRKLDGIIIDRKISLDNHSKSLINMSESSKISEHKTISEQVNNNEYENLSKYIETSLQMSYLEARTIWIQRMISNVYQNSYNVEIQNKILLNSMDINSDLSISPLIKSLSPSTTTTTATATAVTITTSQQSHLGSYGKGIEILEIYRSSWFSVITQFNALFLTSINSTESSQSNLTNCSSISLLSNWIHNQLLLFLQDIKVILSEIDEIISFKLYYEQILMFTIRMSEIGCNFRDSIIPLFESNLIARIEKVWLNGLNQFKQMILTEKYHPNSEEMEAYQNHHNFHQSDYEQIIPLYMQQENLQNVDSSTQISDASNSTSPIDPNKKTSANENLLTPPQELVAFPPLAFLLNIILIGLNHLKDCPLLSLESTLLQYLHKLFLNICEFLENHSNELNDKGKKYLMNLLKDLIKSDQIHENKMDQLYKLNIIEHVIQYSLICFHSIYSGSIIEDINNLDEKYQLIVNNCKEIFEKKDKILN